jgi:alpha-ribazole phosphatase/probable phosphoglycerate mutase
MIEISLVRHVKVTGAPALYGSTDVMPRLAENSHLLATLNSYQQQSEPFKLVVSSPLKRCLIFATAFADNNKIPLKCINTFQELNFGDFDGIPFDDNTFSRDTPLGTKNWAMLEKFWKAPATATLPQAESLADFNQRILAAWQELVDICFKQSEDEEHSKPKLKRILLVAHGGVIRIILAHVLQLAWQNPVLYQNLQISNGSLSKVTITRPFEDSSVNNYQANFIGLPLLTSIGVINS